MNRTCIRFILFLQALVYGFGLLIITEVIPQWGQWYSLSPHYARQVHAFLQGELAISHSPLDLDFDLAWSEGGVHQVWGLGIPLWRLPFTVMGRWLGFEVFPDHIATAFMFSAVAFLVLITFVEPLFLQQRNNAGVLCACGTALILLAFPPLLTVLRTTFGVYEEAVTYAYAYAVVLSVLLFRFVQDSSTPRWVLLALFAGLGGLVRPTLVFYGFAAWLIGTMFILSSSTKSSVGTRAFSIRFKSLACGALAFGSGMGVLFLTNWIRFGHPGEFGHRLNLQNFYGSLYATRFDHPMQEASILVALKELCGALFFLRGQGRDDSSDAGIFWGQADLPRVRLFDYEVYDWTYIAWLVMGTVVLGRWCLLVIRGRVPVNASPWMWVGLWAMTSLALMCCFYLRTPALASRYLVDFGAGFTVFMVIVWSAICHMQKGRIWLGVAMSLSWFVWQWTHSEAGSTQFSSGSCQHAPIFTSQTVPSPGKESATPGSSGIPYDGSGWDPASKVLKCHAILFVEKPEFLELELARNPETTEEPKPQWIRAKIGLEFLKLDSITQTKVGWSVRFHGPIWDEFETGVHPVFVATVLNDRIGDEDSPWVLKKVRWRK